MDQQKDLQKLGEQWERAGLKRRDFLRLAGAGASVATIAGILAACGGSPTATAATTSSSSSAAASTSAAATTSAAASTSKATTSAASSAAGGASTSNTTSAASASSAATPRPSASPASTPGGAASYPYPSGGKYSTIEPATKKGGHVTEGSFADPKTLNPTLVSDTASGNVASMLFMSLVDVNPDTTAPYPELAMDIPTKENGGVSADGLTYTFHLRKDVKWHDGQPFTSKDVLYTYKFMMDPKSTSPRTADLTDRIDTVTAPDDFTVAFKLKKVVAPFIISNASYGIVPAHILESVAVDQVAAHPFSTGDPKQTVGTGPFMFKEWVKGDHMTLVKNPNFYRGEPALDQYVYKVVKDATVVVAQLKTGELDFGSITEATYDDMSKQQNVVANQWDGFTFTYYSYQLDQAKTTVFQDKAVRQALAYAINRDQMIKAIRFGIGQVAVGTMPVPSWAYAPDQITSKYEFNVQKAEQMLDAAGWKKGSDGIRAKDGKKLAFTVYTNAGNNVRMQYITVLQQQWKQIGVDCTPKTEEWNAFLTRINESRDFEMFLVGFSWDVDPDQSTMWETSAYNGGFNNNKYTNPDVDKLIEQGLTELDQSKRKQDYVQMQNLIMDDLPNLIIDFPKGLAAVNKRLHNFKPNAVMPLINRWNSYTWWVDDGK